MINKRLLQYKTTSVDDPLKMANDQRKLNQMINYCETDKCLRQFILSYFGDTTPCTCEKCSNCVVVEDEEEENYIQSGKVRKKALQLAGLSAVGQELFEKLRVCRTKLASDRSVPPYIICSDKTLKDMCAKRPQDRLQMVDVYGMGEQKIKSYGDVFINVIKEFVAEKEMSGSETNTVTETAPTVSSRKKKLPFYIEPEKLDIVELKDKCMISELTDSINAICEENKERRKLSAAFVNELLVNEGYLEEIDDGENKVKRVTEKGKLAGIEENEKRSKYGGKYYAISHTKQSQQMIIEMLKQYYSKYQE